MDKTSLGDRIKSYEKVWRQYLPPKQYFVVRIDGKAFHSYTGGLEKPFDDGLIEDMQLTAKKLCEELQGAQLAYVQSDEISVVLTDLTDIQTQIWFDGNIQKIVSVSASVATAEFNRLRINRALARFISVVDGAKLSVSENFKLAHFDSRVFSISQRYEVLNYLLWRQQDASRNSVQMLARSHFPHKKCENKNSSQLQDMLMLEEGVNWNDLKTHKKRGAVIWKRKYYIPTGPEINPQVERTEWVVDREIPIFSKEWGWFDGKIY